MIAPYLGGPRHTEAIERARFRAKREIARLIAEIDPKPEVPARIDPVAPAAPRRMPMHAIASAFVGPVRSLPEGDRPADWIEPSARGDTGAGGDMAEPEGAHELSDPERARKGADPERAREGADPEQARGLAEAEAALDRAWLARQQARPERPLGVSRAVHCGAGIRRPARGGVRSARSREARGELAGASAASAP